ncbi:MAG: hypothetical protein IJ938_04940 [Clostridia bacterium]|nr:hypothetical protein [Clostridia bacterium]
MFSTDQEAIQCVVTTVLSGDLTGLHFEHIFRAISVLNFASLKSVVFGVLGIVGMIVFVALLMAMLEKHMRIGKRTFNGLIYKLNDNFMSTCGYTFLVLIIYEIWTLLTAALLFFVTRIPVMLIAIVLSLAVYLLMHVTLIAIINMIYLWLPCMQITGFKALEALEYSYQLVEPVKREILIGQLLCLFFAEGLVCLCVSFAPSSFLFGVLTTLLYAFMIMIFCVRMQIVYFDCDQIERADLKYYFK